VSDVVGRRVRLVAGLLVLAELVVFVLVANWIGIGATILATLVTSAIGWALLARQGTRALAELRERARTRQPAGREVGNAGLIAAGGLLMVLPGFVGDVMGLLCLLPGTRTLLRRALASVLLSRLPDRFRGPVRTRAVRVERVEGFPGSGSTRATPLVIEGEVLPRSAEDRSAG
jgi:UPF0716 protein FxsA